MMLLKGSSKGPNREYHLSIGGRLWVPRAGRALSAPSWNDVLKLACLRLFGIEVTESPIPSIAGGSGFSGGGGIDRFVLSYFNVSQFNPLDSSTYEIPSGNAAWTTSLTRLDETPIPIAAVLTDAYWNVPVLGTLGSGETVSHRVRKNNTTDTAGAAFAYTANPSSGSETGLSVSYAAGDTTKVRVVTPAWVTNPTACGLGVALLFRI